MYGAECHGNWRGAILETRIFGLTGEGFLQAMDVYWWRYLKINTKKNIRMKNIIITIILGSVFSLTLGFMPIVKRYVEGQTPLFKLIVLSPEHPHGVYIQQTFSNFLDKEVSVYAASKANIQDSYLNRIERFNKKSKKQDAWRLHIYTGADYLEKMLQEKNGDIALIASNNQLKSTY